MKYLILFLFFVSCKEINDTKKTYDKVYPFDIVNKGLQQQFDIAVLEMYTINSCCKCNCLAVNLNKDNRDTLNILELDLKFEGVKTYSDTTVYFFNFFYKDSLNNENIFQAFSPNFTECMFNGIAFKGNSPKAFPTILGEMSVIDVDTVFLNQSRQNFSKCLENRKLSTTLSQYVKN